MKKHLLFALALFSVVLIGTQKASAGDSGVYTSNLELSIDGGTSVYDHIVIIDEVEYAAIKMGTASKSGLWKLTVPAGTEELSFYAVSWKNKACTLTIEGAAAEPITLALTANDGATGNPPYTIVPNAETEFYTIALSGVEVDTELTFSTEGMNEGEQRCIIWGVNASVGATSFTLAAEASKPEAGKVYAVIAYDYNTQTVANYIMYEENNWYRNVSVKTYSEVTADMLWYVAQNGDGVVVRNVGTGNYINGYPTSSAEFFTSPDPNPVTLYVQNSYTEGCYSLNTVKDGTGNTAMHHKSNDRVVCWNTNAAASDFAFYEVGIPAAKMSELKNYEALKANRALLNSAIADAKTKLYQNISISGDGATAIALQKDDATAPGFVSCSYPDPAEGTDLATMWDNNQGSFFHSTYRLVTNNYHFLEVSVPAGLEAFTFNYVTRKASTNVMPYYITVSCVDANGNVISAMNLTEGFPYTDNTNGVYTSPVIVAAKGTVKVRFAFRTSVGTHAFALAEFGVSEVPAANIEGITVDAALAALISDAEDVLTSKTATPEALRTAYLTLKSAILEHPEYPFTISTDDNPTPYTIKSGRPGDLYYTLTDEGYIHLNEYTGNVNQAWYFREVQDENLNYFVQLVPYSQPDKAMAYTNAVNGAKAVFAADKDDASVNNMWTSVNTNGGAPYGLLPSTTSSTYLSNYGGSQYDMGFWSGSPSGDTGTAQYYEAYDLSNIKLAVGKYFLRNKGNGKFIMNGHSWGTRAVFTSNYGFEFNVTANEDGTYKLGTFVNAGQSLRDSDGFTDQDGNWTLEADAKFGSFKLKGSSGYLGSDGSDVVAVNLSDATTDAAVWEFLTKEQLLAEALAADASFDNPVDFSFLITGRNFCSKATVDNKSWIPVAPSLGGEGDGGNTIINSFNAELWSKQVVVASQTLTGLPDGYYQLNAFAYYRMGNPTSHANHMQAGDLKQNAYIFINDTKQPVKLVSDEAKDASVTGWPTAYTTDDGTVMMYGPDRQSHAAAAFATGAYRNSVIAHVVGGKITLGFGKDDYVASDWFVFDEAQLFYLGDTPSGDVEPGNYYLYNKESGKFLSRGAAWGTQICLDYYGYAFNVSNEGEAHILKVIDWQDGGNNVSLVNGSDGGSFVDNTSTTENKHSFKPVAGGYKISNNANGEYWIVNDPTVNGGVGPHGTEADGLVFEFITPNQYENLIADRWAAEQLAAAQKADVAQTTEALADTLAAWSKVDETHKVKSAALAGSWDGWTWTAGRYRGGGLASNDNGTECYQGTGTLYQKVEGLIPGFYKVSLQGYYRSMGDRVGCYNYSQENIHLSSAYVMANGNVTRIKAVGDDAVVQGNTIYPNWMHEAKDCFDRGLYMNEVYTYVGEDGVLEITIGQPSWKHECWLMMRNVKVTRFIADPYASLRSALDDAAKIDVAAEAMDAAVAAEFKAAVAQGQADLDTNVEAVPADTERINNAIAAVKESIAFYEAADAEFAHEANFYAEGLIGAETFNAALTAAQKSYFDRNLTAEEVEALKVVFNNYVITNVENAGVEMSQLINGTFGDASGATTDGWTYEGNSGTMGTGNHNSWVNVNDGFVERWVGGPGTIEDFEFYQVVEGLPAGTYVVAAHINACQQSNPDDYMVKGIKFYAGSDAIDIHTFNVDRDATNRAIGAGRFFTAATIKEGESLKLGISVIGTDANWFLMDNVKLYNLDPVAALAVVVEKAKALVAENPDVKGQPLAHLSAEIAAANDINGLSEAMEFFKSAIDIYTKFAALQRQYDEVALLVDANKAAKAVLFSATIPVDNVYPAYETYKQAVFEYCMAIASVDAPVDVTDLYVKNPKFNQGVENWDTYSDVTGWGSPHAWQSQGASYTNGNTTIQQFIESWGAGNACGRSYALQTSDIPNGFYKFSADIIATVQGAADTKAAVEGAYLVFGDGKTAVATGNSLPERFEVYGNVTGGQATFGFDAANTNANWICMDNVKLEYVGHQKVVGYFTLADKVMEEGAEDPIYKMLVADPKVKVVYNEVDADFDGSLKDYDAIIVQESFSSTSSALIDGVLSIGKANRPMLFNKTYALGSKRGTEDGKRDDAQGDYFVNVYDNVSRIFAGIEGNNVRVFYDGATDAGAAGSKGLSYLYEVSQIPEGSLIAAPSTVDNASIAISDFHAGTQVGGKTTQARVITFNMNYGAICREGGKYLTDEAYTMWRNATYMLLGLHIPEEMVNMAVNDVCETTGVTLDVTATEVGEDSTVTITATVLPETAADKRLVWTSSDENIATVANGVVTGINKGECDITVATVDGGFTASCHITVFRTRFYTYDFREWSVETLENVAADAKSKTNWQKLGSYYKSTSSLTEGAMTTEAGDIAEAEGLLFTITSGNLRVYYGESDADNYVLFFAAGSVVVPTVLYDQVTACIDDVETTYTSGGTTFVIDITKGSKLNWIQVDACGVGIKDVVVESDVVSSTIYSVDGQKLAQPVKGVNVIKKTHADGTVTTEKVLVK